MTVKKYRKKPVEIEAIQYRGDAANCDAVHDFMGIEHDPDAVHDSGIDIETLEGRMHVSVGDYIIRGVQGEFYPCKPHIFEQTYEPA